MTQIPAEFQWTTPAILENVDQICAAAEIALNPYHLSQKDRFAIALLMREALNNAVIHGCKKDPTLTISCRLWISEFEVAIEISDCGAGFDWRSPSLRLSEPGSDHGRGMTIYKLYATSISFNQPGNCVTLKRIVEGGIHARHTNSA